MRQYALGSPSITPGAAFELLPDRGARIVTRATPWENAVAGELSWMLERIGCEDVEVEFLDYNMLQFKELSAEHTECLATLIEDPSQSDTILAAGRRPVE